PRMIPADSSAIAQPIAAPTPTTQAASVAACGGAPAAACSSAAVAHAPNTANVAAMTQHRITTWRTRLMLRIHSTEPLHRGLEWQTAPTGTLSGAGTAGSDDKRPNPGAFEWLTVSGPRSIRPCRRRPGRPGGDRCGA